MRCSSAKRCSFDPRSRLQRGPSQSRAAPQRLGFSLSKWRTVLRSLLKNLYRTTYRCYSFSETSSQDELSAAIGSSNRHVGGEYDLGDVRHRLVGWTSTSAFSATLLPLRSLSPRDVAASRKVFVIARSARLRALATCMIHRYADRIIAHRAAVDHDADELRRRLRQPVAAP